MSCETTLCEDSRALKKACVNAFQVDLSENTIEEIHSFAGLHKAIVCALERRSYTPCLSWRIFSRMRKALTSIHAAPRPQIRLNTPLKQLFPLGRRRALWQEMASQLNFEPPSLKTIVPEWFIFWFSIIFGIGLVITLDILAISTMPQCRATSYLSTVFSVVSVFLVFAVPAMIAFTLNRCLARRFPDNCKVLGDLVQAIRSQYYAVAEQNGRPPSEVWYQLLRVIEQQCNVPPEMIHPEASIQECLHECSDKWDVILLMPSLR